MFAVVEYFDGVGAENDDSSATCLTHTEKLDAAQKAKKEGQQLSFDFRTERFDYDIIEFKGECPNCGRNFEF